MSSQTVSFPRGPFWRCMLLGGPLPIGRRRGARLVPDAACTFAGLRADIAAVLSGTLPLDASPAKAVTDGWASQFEAARQCVADGSRGLPPYDAEASQQLLGRLREEIDGARSKVTPKRKFAFGRRRQRETGAGEGAP